MPMPFSIKVLNNDERAGGLNYPAMLVKGLLSGS